MNETTTTEIATALTTNEDVLSDITINYFMQTVSWLYNESEAGRKTFEEASTYYYDVIRLIERSAAAKAGK